MTSLKSDADGGTVGVIERSLPYAQAKEQVRILVEGLLQRACLKQPPFVPEGIAYLQGVRHIVLEPLGRIDGCLLPGNDGLTIILNKERPPVRRNFSCAHEIVHTFFLDKSHNVAFRCEVGQPDSDCEERLCDYGANEIILPTRYVTEVLKRHRVSMSLVTKARGWFNASYQPVAIKFTELSEEPVALVCWEWGDRNGAGLPKLRVSWRALSRPLREQHIFIPRHAPAPPNSGVCQAYSLGHAIGRMEEIQLGSLRGTFFVESKRFDYPGGRYVLSLIFLDRTVAC